MPTDIAKLKLWLQGYGCEIIPVTSDYEAIRFKGSQVGVLYKSGNVSNHYTSKALECFHSGKKWDGGPVSTGRHAGYKKQKLQLLKRDGSACFFCGELLGEDITVEHLVALTAGGTNQISNMVLAHEKCNQAAGTLSISEKVARAIKFRVEKLTNK